MPVTPPPEGAASRAPDPRLDGRLDLDDLDRPLDLDLISTEDDTGPLLSEWVEHQLDRLGVLTWLRAHRLAARAIAGTLAVVLAAAGIWWVLRPAPLGEQARVQVSNGGNEPARVTVDSLTGQAIGITQIVLVTSSEPPGVLVDTLEVRGPGLTRGTARVPRAQPGRPTTGPLTASIECASPESTLAVLAATPADYRVHIRRTSTTTGEVRESDVALAGAEEWLTDLRTACTQIAADSDLTVAAVSASIVPDVVAADLDLTIVNSSSRPWGNVRVSTLASPSVVNAGLPTDIPAGSRAHVLARLWPTDCSDPVSALTGGLLLRATIGEGAQEPSVREPTFHVLLDGRALDTVSAALRSTCAADPPTLSLDRVRLREGAGSNSAGVLDITAVVNAAGASRVEAERLGILAAGQLAPVDTPVDVVDGKALLRMRWILPPCLDLLSAGRPRAVVTLVGDLRRPFVVTMRGEALQVNLTRLCGSTVASIAR